MTIEKLIINIKETKRNQRYIGFCSSCYVFCSTNNIIINTQIIPNCVCNKTYSFMVDNQKNKDLFNKLKQIKSDINLNINLNKLLIKRTQDGIDKIKEIISENKITKLLKLIDTFQTRTMIIDFKDFLTRKLKYMKDRVKEENSDFIREMLKRQIIEYQTILSILGKGFENLLEEYNSLLIIVQIKD